MSDHHGRFVWYELTTTDVAAARAFYETVVGWTGQDSGVPGMEYTLLMAGDAGAAGLMALPDSAQAAGARPGWIGFVAVDDVDGTAADVVAEGGQLDRAPTDIPGIGRLAMLRDPQGAAIALFKPAGDGTPPPSSPPGQGGWRELLASDWETAFAFYAKHFGWTKADAIDMGPMGTYQLVACGGVTFGGMMTKPPSVPAPFWMYYFDVAEIGPAADRVRAAGGQVVNGPHEVPGSMWIVQCVDPQGALFSLVAPH